MPTLVIPEAHEHLIKTQTVCSIHADHVVWGFHMHSALAYLSRLLQNFSQQDGG